MMVKFPPMTDSLKTNPALLRTHLEALFISRMIYSDTGL